MKYLMILLFAFGSLIIQGQDTLILKRTFSEVYVNYIAQSKTYIYYEVNGEQKKIPLEVVHEIRKSPNSKGLLGDLEKINTGYYQIQKVVDRPGMTKDQLFTSLRMWFSESYNDADEVLDMDDREGGVLIGTGWGSFRTKLYGSASKLYITVKIEVKDGRFRFTLSPFKFYSPSTYSGGIRIPESTEYLQDKIDRIFNKKGQMKVGTNNYNYLMDAFKYINNLSGSLENMQIDAKSTDDDW